MKWKKWKGVEAGCRRVMPTLQKKVIALSLANYSSIEIEKCIYSWKVHIAVNAKAKKDK